jgi:hypothetical protein
MAERSVRAAGWRSRPGVVRVAAALLGPFGPLPAARRPRPTAKAAPASTAQDQPHGWTRPFAGWGSSRSCSSPAGC